MTSELEWLRRLEQQIKSWGPFDVDYDGLLGAINQRIISVLKQATGGKQQCTVTRHAGQCVLDDDGHTQHKFTAEDFKEVDDGRADS